ncbi:MAG: signal recognition particle protein [Lachnospiraceae bacterium]|nr:signal recognition particle protein [Lachnospiraceae bacterium]
MAFESLTEKLQNVFKNLRGKGKLTETDVKTAMKEVKMALLEADVNFKVVKNFVKTVEERAVGQDVMNGLNPGQMVIKIVNEELINLMGGEGAEIEFQPGKAITVLMMCGLQGAGKTTTTAKLAGKYKLKGKKCLLVACDVYRPAAIKQLQVNGEKQGVEVFSMGDQNSPVDIAKASIEHAKKNGHNLVILDTAGRLHIDEEMMEELHAIKENVDVHQTILVVDVMTGQDAVNVAKQFDEKVGIDGVILSKMDGDSRGGAALSVKAVTGKPIFFAGMGEKLSDLEQFYPDRMANRILGMGDVLTLIEKAQESIDISAEKEKEMTDHMKKGRFDFEDYLESMRQMKKMGGLASILSMMPGMGINAADLEGAIDEKQMARMEAIVLSMTPAERRNPKLLNPSRKHRIARGAGVDIAVVNRFIKQFEQSQKMMKSLPGMMGGKKGKRGGFGGLGGFGGMGGLGKGRMPF